MPPTLRLVLFLLFGLATLLQASRDPTSVLVLDNGDRITGREIRREEGVIQFQSELLGILTVSEEHARVEPSDPSEAAATAAVNAAATESAPSGKGGADRDSAAIPAPDPTKKVAGGETKPFARKGTLRRQIDFGLTTQSGRRDRFDIALRGSLERQAEHNEMRLQGRYIYGKSDGSLVTDNLTASARFRQDLSPRMFAQSESRYETDSIKPLDHDFNQSLGVGRSLVEREGFKMAVGGGAAVRYRDIPTDPAPEWIYLVDAFQDMVYSINHRLSITQDLSLLGQPFGTDDEFLFKLNAALTNKLTDTLDLKLRYEYEYDRSLAEAARKNQRIVTSVAYVF